MPPLLGDHSGRTSFRPAVLSGIEKVFVK